MSNHYMCGLTVSPGDVKPAWPQSSFTRIEFWVPWSSEIQVDEVKNCKKEKITAIRIFTVSQKGSHVQKLKLVFIYLVFTFKFAQHKEIRPHT
jgi:hypothetical protein